MSHWIRIFSETVDGIFQLDIFPCKSSERSAHLIPLEVLGSFRTAEEISRHGLQTLNAQNGLSQAFQAVSTSIHSIQVCSSKLPGLEVSWHLLIQGLKVSSGFPWQDSVDFDGFRPKPKTKRWKSKQSSRTMDDHIQFKEIKGCFWNSESHPDYWTCLQWISQKLCMFCLSTLRSWLSTPGAASSKYTEEASLRVWVRHIQSTDDYCVCDEPWYHEWTSAINQWNKNHQCKRIWMKPPKSEWTPS